MYKLSIPIPDKLASDAKQAAERDNRSLASFVKAAIQEKLNREPQS